MIFLLVALSVATISAQTTSFVSVEDKLVGYAEPEWFVANVPFLEVPDAAIEAVYYYRWTSLKRHLRYATPGAGYVITEFVHKVGYSQKFDTINAAAGHHIDEARWLRNSRYVKDYISVWGREGGGNQQYSEWIADAAWNAFLLNGDADFISAQLTGLVTNFRGWDHKFEPDLDLYFLSPHDDAMEHSASSEQTDDPYHGGLGYRPSFNSEMYANAVAISKIAALVGDSVTEAEYTGRANAIREAIVAHLWDPVRQFFYHVYREDNPNLDLLDAREEIGFYPWRWEVPPKDDPTFEAAWVQLLHPEGFNSAYGPTTCEMRSQWFDGNQTSQCCWWNGNSWPYSTGHTLRALAAQLKRYPSAFVTVADYVGMLNKYARTQYKDGEPYVAECHSPHGDFWVCDGRNHSEHYAHSTYNDNVLSDLIGIEPQGDDFFQVNPLVPATWDYFIAEHVAYHGHNVTVLWDRDGSRYNSSGGAGMQVWVDGELAGSRATVGLMKVEIPSPISDPSYPSGRIRQENYATNVNGFGYPVPSASYTTGDSSVWQAVDGRIFYDFVPSNRWSNYGNRLDAEDWFAINFGPGRVKVVNQVRLYVYSDFREGGGVDCPTSISAEFFDTTLQAWTPTLDQVLTPAICLPNNVLTIDFRPVATEWIRLIFTNNVSQGTFVGVSEVEIWAIWPQSDVGYEAEDGYLTGTSDILASPTASGGSYVGARSGDDDMSAEFTGVWVDVSGDYEIVIGYTNGAQVTAGMSLRVNNFHEVGLSFPPTETGWGEFNLDEGVIRVTVPLWRGGNVLIFRQTGVDLVQLDRIRIIGGDK